MSIGNAKTSSNSLLPNPGRILPKSSSRSKLNFDSRKAAQHDPKTICSSCKVRSCSKHSDRKLAALHESLVEETHGERATTTTTTTRLRATLIQRKRRRPQSSEFIDITLKIYKIRLFPHSPSILSWKS